MKNSYPRWPLLPLLVCSPPPGRQKAALPKPRHWKKIRIAQQYGNTYKVNGLKKRWLK